MVQVQYDLDTRLDWLAADHFNTGYPHTHIVIRGRDDKGKDLVIAHDYICYGLRARARALVEPRTRTGKRVGTTAQARQRDDAGTLHVSRPVTLGSGQGRRFGDSAMQDLDLVGRASRVGRLKTLQKSGSGRGTASRRWVLGAKVEASCASSVSGPTNSKICSGP